MSHQASKQAKNDRAAKKQEKMEKRKAKRQKILIARPVDGLN
jgi:hypothetical protein